MADYLILPTLEPIVYKDGDSPLKFIGRLVAQAEAARKAYEAEESRDKQENDTASKASWQEVITSG